MKVMGVRRDGVFPERRGSPAAGSSLSAAGSTRVSRPTLWAAAAALADSLYAAGDDAGAEDGASRARAEIDAFAAGLSQPRKERFLAAPQLAELSAFAS
jgi:hypothetical protein